MAEKKIVRPALVKKVVLERAEEEGVLEIKNDPQTGNIACFIGGLYFFFDVSPLSKLDEKTYKAVVDRDKIFDMILAALKAMREDDVEDMENSFLGEYTYYANILKTI